ncbi:HPF/RaiA family ribosome-associated protein [Defluviicoccus vanus]|nr:HPF/RaiA family ribosome-associated protein [Defluviicoccus vanus]
MLFPLKIDFQNMEASEFVTAKVRQRADKLAQIREGIMGCHVTVQAPHRHHHRGNVYCIRIVAQVAGRTLVAGRESGHDPAHTDVYVAIRDAFNAIERRLMTYTNRRRGDVKRHADDESALMRASAE